MTDERKIKEITKNLEQDYTTEGEQYALLRALADAWGYVVLEGYDYEFLREEDTDMDYRVIVRRNSGVVWDRRD